MTKLERNLSHLRKMYTGLRVSGDVNEVTGVITLLLYDSERQLTLRAQLPRRPTDSDIDQFQKRADRFYSQYKGFKEELDQGVEGTPGSTGNIKSLWLGGKD